MRILVEENMEKEKNFIPRRMFFDIVLKPNYEDIEELNKKGNQFRDRVDKLSRKGDEVGKFMPMPEIPKGSYAFFVVTCPLYPLERRIRMKEIIKKSTGDGDLMFLEERRFNVS